MRHWTTPPDWASDLVPLGTTNPGHATSFERCPESEGALNAGAQPQPERPDRAVDDLRRRIGLTDVQTERPWRRARTPRPRCPNRPLLDHDGARQYVELLQGRRPSCCVHGTAVRSAPSGPIAGCVAASTPRRTERVHVVPPALSPKACPQCSVRKAMISPVPGEWPATARRGPRRRGPAGAGRL